MKLAAQYSKASIIITVSVLFIAGIVYYIAISYIANNQLDRDLTEEIDEVVDYVKLNHRLPKQVDFDEDQTTFFKTDQKQFKRRFFDTIYNNPRENKNESGRAVAGLVTLNGENYKVIVAESKEATEYLIQMISAITVALMALLLLILVITNRFILNGLWQSFFNTLRQLKAFNITDDSDLNLKATRIDEFRELNDAVLTMSSKVKTDYQNLKSFTENASHEMMTPIAVVISKLDTLIQDETLNAEQYAQITGIYGSINKLSRLNQSLLLLVKIDNNLIYDNVTLDLKDVILEKLSQFQELIQNKKITITFHPHEKAVNLSKSLVDILINNLLSNAIKHNYNGGEIHIELNSQKLIFKNTGEKMQLEENKIFERFQKSTTSEGTGLGLTIVKNICNSYGFKISYYYREPLHCFEIDFNGK